MPRLPGASAFVGLPTAFWRLWIACLINRLGTFVVPFLALFLGSERGLEPATVGLVVGAFGAGAMGAGPLGGLLADRLGRRRTIALGMVLCAAALGALLGAEGVVELAACTFLLGLAHELPRPAQSAMVADLVPEADRARAFGALYWAANLGFALASLLAGLASLLSFTLLFVLDGLTSLACGLVVLFTLPESAPARGPARSRSALGDMTAPFRDRAFLRFFALSILVALVFFQFSVTMPLHLRAEGVGTGTYGALVAINGVLIVFVQPFVGPRIARVPRARALALGALLNGVGFGLFGVGSSVVMFATAIVILTLGEIVMAPLNPAVVADLAPAHLRGAYQGAFGLAISLAACLAPIFGSAVLEHLGATTLWAGCFVLGVVATAGHLLWGRPDASPRPAPVVATGDGHVAGVAPLLDVPARGV
jgi:MFS family permease